MILYEFGFYKPIEDEKFIFSEAINVQSTFPNIVKPEASGL